ncbi:unnamed protein product [Hanseniaspora opuntiae]
MSNFNLGDELKSKRLILACHMCKKQKIKCDKEMPQCGSCFKKGIPCLSTCPGTQRQVPRSYIMYLEDLLFTYSEKLESLGVDVEQIKGNFPGSYHDAPVNVDLYRERFDDNNEPIKSEKKYIKRLSSVRGSSEADAYEEKLKSTSMPVKRDVQHINTVSEQSSIIKKLKSDKNVENGVPSFESITLTPSNSNISKNNIMESYENATAMKQSESMHSSLPEYNLTSNLKNETSNFNTNISQKVSDSRRHSRSKNSSNVSKTYLGDSSGIPFAKLMLTAIKFQNDLDFTDGEDCDNLRDIMSENCNDSGVHDTEIPVVEDNVDRFTLPSVKEAQKLLKCYFHYFNPQYPIFEFSLFYNRFYKPLFGADQHFHMLDNQGEPPLEADATLPYCFKVIPDEKYQVFIEKVRQKVDLGDYYTNFKEYKDGMPHIIPFTAIIDRCKSNKVSLNIFHNEFDLPQVYRRALFFYNLAASLGSCSKVLINRTVHAITLKKRAMFWIKDVLDDTHFNSDTEDSFNIIKEHYLKLESLSAMLLLSIFAMCLPSIPSVWYSLGMPLRMLVDLGLHNEKYNSELLFQAHAVQSSNGDKEIVNSVELLIDNRRRLFWSTYSMDRQLALYFGRPTSIGDEYLSCQMISYRSLKLFKFDEFSSCTRIISVAMMGIRRLQSELLNVMYASSGQVPKEFENLEHWKVDFERRLNKWYNKRVPKNFGSSDSIKFKKEFFRINFHHTKTMLNGISPRDSGVHTIKELDKLRNSTSNMIFQYKRLWVSKSLNYTWIACHNLFMCSMTYLYSLYKLEDLEDLDKTIGNVLTIMKSFIGTCEAAPNCYKSINVLSKAIKKLILKGKQQSNLNNNEPAITVAKTESEATDADLKMFFDLVLNADDFDKDIEANANPDLGGLQENASEEFDLSWGLDSEHKYNANTENYFGKLKGDSFVSEDRKIYDMLYFHANNITTRDLGGFILNTDNTGNERNNSSKNSDMT